MVQLFVLHITLLSPAMHKNQTKQKHITNVLKDAMPVSYRSELFASYILTILKSETYSRKYEELPNIVIHACKNIK